MSTAKPTPQQQDSEIFFYLMSFLHLNQKLPKQTLKLGGKSIRKKTGDVKKSTDSVPVV